MAMDLKVKVALVLGFCTFCVVIMYCMIRLKYLRQQDKEHAMLATTPKGGIEVKHMEPTSVIRLVYSGRNKKGAQKTPNQVKICSIMRDDPEYYAKLPAIENNGEQDYIDCISDTKSIYLHNADGYVQVGSSVLQLWTDAKEKEEQVKKKLLHALFVLLLLLV